MVGKPYDLNALGYKVIEHNENIDATTFDTIAIHKIRKSKTSIDILVKGFENISRESTVLVCFSAAVSHRKKKVAPFFSGIGVSEELNLPLIAIADPTVSDYPVSLSWYAGNKNIIDLQQFIANLLEEISKQLGFKQYIAFGGSGGGFACLVQLMLVKEIKIKSLVMNPQTSILEYHPSSVTNYISEGFGLSIKDNRFKKDIARKIFEENSIIYEASEQCINDKHELVYLQNSKDYHVGKHLIPFISNSSTKWRRMNSCSFNSGDNKFLLVGSWGEGHISPPIEVILYILKGFAEDKPLKLLIEELEERQIAFNNICEFYDDAVFDIEWDFDYIFKDEECKVKVYSIALSKMKNVSYAFYLIHAHEGIIHKNFYEEKNYRVLPTKHYDIKDLSIKAFVKLPNNRKLSKLK